MVAVRSALQAQLENRALPGELRRAIHVMCGEARRKDLRAEQLLVVFKQTLTSLPEMEQLPRGPERNDFLSRIVTMCIEEFYAEHDKQ